MLRLLVWIILYKCIYLFFPLRITFISRKSKQTTKESFASLQEGETLDCEAMRGGMSMKQKHLDLPKKEESRSHKTHKEMEGSRFLSSYQSQVLINRVGDNHLSGPHIKKPHRNNQDIYPTKKNLLLSLLEQSIKNCKPSIKTQIIKWIYM